MTASTCKRLPAIALAAAAITTLTAGPALAAPSTFKPKLGTYKAKESTGQKFILVIGPCDGDFPSGPICLYGPDSVQGKNNYDELVCKGVDGASDGDDDFDEIGPFRVGNGTIRHTTTSSDANNGTKEKVTYTFKIATNGTLRGTGRITESYSTGGGCDSGSITITAKR